MRSIIPVALVWATLLSPMLAHDFWVLASRNEMENRVEVTIGGGHHFPKSEMVPSVDRIQSLRWIGDDGGVILLESVEGKRERTASVAPGQTMTGAVELILQHPRRSNPDVIAVGLVPGATLSPRGEEQEIVLLQSPSGWRADQPFLVELRQGGAPVDATWTVHPERGTARYAKSTPDQPAQLKLEPGQRYLVTTTLDGTSMTLTFRTAD
jgi:hypothetical protein